MDNNTDHVDKNVEPEYSFHITALAGGTYNAAYDIESTIPGIQKSKVSWTVTPSKNVDYFHDGDFFNVARTADCSITASYVYNGKTYTDTYWQKGVKQETAYTIDIYLVERIESRAVYAIKTDIPGCTVGTAAWTVASAHRGGWVDGGQYIVDEAGMENGESYTVTASYTYNGQTYSASCTYTYTEQPSANVFPVIPDVIPTIRH